VMRLSTMWSIDRTIDASGSSAVAAHILANWLHDPGSLHFFRSSANFVYVFSYDGRQHFLRFTEKSERSRDAVETEVALLRWLAGAGIAVAVPVPSKRSNDVETMTTAWGTFHAVVFPAVAGTQFALDELDLPQFQAWGAVLGRLHTTLTTCPVEISSALPTWREWLEQQRRYLDDDAPVIRDEGERISETLETLPVNGATFGLIHYDVELDNLVWDDHTIHVLDFDDCQRCWYVADIAFALRDFFDDGASVNDPAVQAFVSGYVAHHPLDEDPFTHLPLFMRLANFLTYVQSVRALDLVEDPTQPEWLNELIRKLRRRRDTYEQSLAARGP
jgi:Ser/Thr protein kinase RdoA (MazF antagonist)